MVISDKHEIIFIHIPRTGGKFVTKILNETGFKKVNLNGDTHFSISVAQEYLGEKFKGYRAFTIIRNPWDYYVSLYQYIKNSRCQEWKFFGGQNMGFKQWLENIALVRTNDKVYKDFKNDHTSTATLYKAIHQTNQNIGWLSLRFVYSTCYQWKAKFEDKNLYMVNQDIDVLRFENIREELKKYFSKSLSSSDLKKFDTNIKINASKRKDTKSYYDEETKSLVENQERLIINKYDYDFK